MSDKTHRIIEGILNKSPRFLAKGITEIENNPETAKKILRNIDKFTGRSHIVGITGYTGSGKSSLINRLTKEIRKNGLSIGIVAIDPTSPFSGGALLGDRIRMDENVDDDGVFIRSMGTRGWAGGLSQATKGAIKLIDAYGMDIIFVETTGVGQTDIEILHASDTTILVLAPGNGDAIQVFKAGIMEIGDIYVISKSDVEGAHRLYAETKRLIDQNSHSGWTPKVMMTTLNEPDGFEQVINTITKHRLFLIENHELQKKRSEYRKNELFDIVMHRIKVAMKHKLLHDDQYATLLQRVANGDLDIYTAADMIMDVNIKLHLN